MKLALSFLFFIFLGAQVRATHVIGLNISYEHISGDSFEVTCEVPSNCSGTFFNNGNCINTGPGPSSVSFFLFCEEQGFSDTVTAYHDTIIDASPVCKSNPIYNSCSYGPCGYMGFQIRKMTAIIDFSVIDTGSCGTWRLVLSTGARSSGQNYVGQPWNTVWASLNREDYPKNSSVEFKNPQPLPFYCAGKQVTHHWGGVDPDGDSLFWELDTALDSYSSGSFTSVNYVSGFSPTQPLLGPISFNPSNGDLSFTTHLPLGYIVGIYAVAVKVSEYDRSTGELKGQLHRDVHFFVVDSCDNEAPQVISPLYSSAEVYDSISIQTCQGQDIAIDLVFADYDSSGALSTDSLVYSCNLGDYLDSVSYSATGTNPDTFHIVIYNFESSQSEIQFNLFVEDTFCPHPGYNDYTYRILSGDHTYLRDDTTICVDDTLQLDAHGGDTFLWQVLSGDPIIVGTNFGCVGCQKPWVHITQPTVYLVTSNMPQVCGNTDTIFIDVFEAYEISFDAINGGTADHLIYCASDEPDSFVVAPPNGVYSGSGIVNAMTGIFDPSSLNVAPGVDSTIALTYAQIGSCPNDSTLKVRIKGLPDVQITSGDTFLDTVSNVQLSSPFVSGTWSSAIPGNPTISGVFNPSVFFAPDSILIFHNGSDSGCFNLDSMRVFIIAADTTVGVSDEKSAVLRFYPNPTKNVVHIESDQLVRHVRIMDERGFQLQEVSNNDHILDLELKSLPSGLYMVEMELEDGEEIYRRLIIQ